MILERGKFKRSKIHTNERLVIIGRTGTGKSLFADTVMTYLAKSCFIVLIDVKNEYIHIPVLDFKTFYTQKRGIVRINNLTIKVGRRTIKTDDLYKITEFICSNLFKYNLEQREAKKPLRKCMILCSAPS